MLTYKVVPDDTEVRKKEEKLTHVKSGQKKVEKDLEKDTESETINLPNKKNFKAPDAYFKRNGVSIFVECSRKNCTTFEPMHGIVSLVFF